MSRAPLRVNHSVTAAVRLPPNFEWGECASIMRDEGWSVHEGDSQTVITLPLYCAKSVALRQARRKLRDFSQSRVPIIVDELRLLVPEPDIRRISTVKNIGRWTKILPERLQASHEFMVDPVGWEVSIARSAHNEIDKRQRAEIDNSEQKLRNSILPGRRFDRSGMNISTSAEPKKITTNPWGDPRSTLLFGLGFIAVFGVGSISSTLFWLGVLRQYLEDYFSVPVVDISVPIIWSALFGALVSAVAGGHWATGNRVSIWSRGLAMFGFAFVFAGIGFVFCLQFDNFSRIMITAVFLGLFLMLLLGWIHLCVLWPSTKVLWSIPSLSLLVAGGSFFAQSFFSIWESEFGLPGGAIIIPGWMRIILSLIVILWMCGCVFVIGSAVGWSAFLGAGSSGVMSYLLIGFTSTLMLILLITSGFLSDFQNRLRL